MNHVLTLNPKPLRPKPSKPQDRVGFRISGFGFEGAQFSRQPSSRSLLGSCTNSDLTLGLKVLVFGDIGGHRGIKWRKMRITEKKMETTI